MRRLTSIGCSWTSKPATLALPSVGGRKQVRMRMVVVFPAPLGPRKPTICPLSTSKEMLSTATVRAYRLVRPSTLIILRYPGRNELSGCHFGRTPDARNRPPAGKTVKFHHTDGRQVLSNEGCGDRGLRNLEFGALSSSTEFSRSSQFFKKHS